MHAARLPWQSKRMSQPEPIGEVDLNVVDLTTAAQPSAGPQLANPLGGNRVDPIKAEQRAPHLHQWHLTLRQGQACGLLMDNHPDLHLTDDQQQSVFAGTPATGQEEQLFTHLTVLVTSIHDLPHAHPVVERVPLKIRGLRKVAKKTEEPLRAWLLFQGQPSGISLRSPSTG
ncbi:hypothetical protein D9M73_140740 [compost metagenome]